MIKSTKMDDGSKKIKDYLSGDSPETLGERIDMFLITKKISRDQFGKDCGVSGTTVVSGYVRGERNPTSEFIELAAKKYDINPRWLILGEGEMSLSREREGLATFFAEKMPPIYENECLKLRNEAVELKNRLLSMQLDIQDAVRNACHIAGLSMSQAETIQQSVMFYKHWKDYEGAKEQCAKYEASKDIACQYQPAAGNGE